MNVNLLPVALATLRTTIVKDPNIASKHAIAVDLPPGFIALDYGSNELTRVIFTGYGTKAKALEDATSILAEIACKMANAVIDPDHDGPHCRTSVSWIRIRTKA